MDIHETPQFELPKPAPQIPEAARGRLQEQSPGRAFPERQAPRANQAPAPQGALPPLQPLPQQMAGPHQMAQPTTHRADPSAQVRGPSKADDVDVIEKEWVTRAKQVLDHTKHDPHRKTSAIGALKTDYMSKRFGKTKG